MPTVKKKAKPKRIELDATLEQLLLEYIEPHVQRLLKKYNDKDGGIRVIENFEGFNPPHQDWNGKPPIKYQFMVGYSHYFDNEAGRQDYLERNGREAFYSYHFTIRSDGTVYA